MVNINGKPWNKLRAVDIKKYLDNPEKYLEVDDLVY